MKNNREKGKYGEDIACKYLESKGYKIIKRNFHFSKISEIDIICEKDDTLVFVEVKARSSTEYGDPIHAINEAKRNSVRKAAEGYLYINKINDKACRLDVVLVDTYSNPPKAKHIENAF